MAQLSMSQVAQIALNAGLPRDKVPTAVAIAWAESRGNTNAHNTTPPDNSYGLWQINMYGSLGPARRSQFNLTSNDQLFDANTNARAMMAISSSGRNWTPWTTFTRGTYLAFLSDAKKALTTGADNAVPLPTPVSNNGLDNVTTVIKTITNPQTYLRTAYFAIGLILIGIALVRVSGAEKLAKAVGSSKLANAIPAGKIARMVK